MNNRTNDKGTVLVTVLWLSLILSLLAVTLVSITQRTRSRVSIDNQLAQKYLIAEGAISIAAHQIADPTEPWFPGRTYETTVGNTSVSLQISSPLAKVDINYVSSINFARLLMELGIPSARANEMSDAMLDWRDPDDLVRLNGAESTAYISAGRTEGPGNRPFRSTQELIDVLGFDPALVACLSPWVTVQSGTDYVDPFYARGPVRRAFGFGEIPGSTPTPSRRGSLAGQVYEVTATTALSEFSSVRIQTVLRYTGIPSDSVWFHSWTRDIVATNQIDDDQISCVAGDQY